MTQLLSPKQLEFVLNSTRKWNIAHGSVRCGKTVGINFRFMQAVNECPDSQIYIVGHTFDTAYRNVVRSIMESDEMAIWRPFCNWSGKKFYFKDKAITILGAKDEGAIGNFQGNTFSLVYCDEITLYPDSIIDMIDTRLSKPWSKGFATCNPSNPDHKVKKWIDEAEKGNPDYYSLHFTLDDNPYVDESYKQRIKNSLSGLFYKRNYLGIWCLADGAIFDFFDPKIYVLDRPPVAAEYWVAGIDYGASNPFACVLVGVSTGRSTQTGKKLWVEAEYFWDHKAREATRTNSELARDVYQFLEPYDVKGIYIDPSAAAFKKELARLGMHTINADNDVLSGITTMTSEMRKGNLYVLQQCKNTIREIQSYVWDSKAARNGIDEPIKKDDHIIDSLRYVLSTHKVPVYQPYKQENDPDQYRNSRFDTGKRRSIF